MSVSFPSIRLLVHPLGEFTSLHVIPPSAVRCYFAICKLADQGSPITFRGIGRVTGVNVNATRLCVNRLIKEGLVSQVGHRGKDGGRSSGTIRPLFRVELFSTGKISNRSS